MENLKIKVNSEAESKEAQELFFELGYSHSDDSTEYYRFMGDYPRFLSATSEGIFSGRNGLTDCKEITLPQLRDLVVLKRKPMKEYLDKNQNYKLVLCDEKDKEEGFIEVPEGATHYAEDANLGIKKNYFFKCPDDAVWVDSQWMRASFSVLHQNVLWKRHTQPEELPFIDDEPSLNDQYAEIEKVRQSKIDETLAERQAQYGCFEDVAFVTESIMGILSKVRGNGLQDLPYPHRMALYMIASKMARIVNGDLNHLDSWHDIGGYAKLIEKLIDSE